MATKSFLKTVDIRDKRLANAFATALQKAETVRPSTVEYKSTPKEIKGDDIKVFFDAYKKQHDKV